MYVVAFLNEKGGVGKTTLTNHVGAGLAAMGLNVMVIDADPQGHATIRFGVKKAPMLYDLLVRDADWDAVAVRVAPERYCFPGEVDKAGRLYVVASNVETRGIGNAIGDETVLAQRLDELADLGLVDVVLIDTSPTPSLFHITIYTAADGVIYPTELAYSSFDGLVESIKHRIDADKRRSTKWGLPPLNLLGIVPTKYREGTREQDDNLQKLKIQFGAKVWAALRLRTIWTETEPTALPVWQLEPNGKAMDEFQQVLDKVKDVVYVTA